MGGAWLWQKLAIPFPNDFPILPANLDWIPWGRRSGASRQRKGVGEGIAFFNQ